MYEHCRGCIRYLKSCSGMTKAVCEKHQLRIPRTNADIIRSMKDEELAELISSDWCEIVCGPETNCQYADCRDKILNWLREEAEEVTDK